MTHSTSNQLTRRQFILGASGTVAMAAIGTVVYRFAPFGKRHTTYVLMSKDLLRNDTYFIVAYEPDQRSFSDIPIHFYGHSIIPHSRPGKAVMFAQRPGTYACEVDFLEGTVAKKFETAENRHFYGHGCYNNDGSLLFCTENNFDDGQGVIAIRNADTYEYEGEFPSYGVGPHDMWLVDDGNTLVVANGGNRTHPDQKDGYLPVETTGSTLSYVDIRSGELLEQVVLDDSELMMKHLALGGDDTVFIGMQGGSGQPNLAYHQRGQELRYFDASDSLYEAMKGHTLSLANYNDQCLAVTSLTGGQITFWDIPSKRFLKSYHVETCKGVVAVDDRFIVTASGGLVMEIDPVSLAITYKDEPMDGSRWGSHLMSITV